MQSATPEIIADVPALLLGHRLDVLATTTWPAPLSLDFDALPAGEPNMARYMFLNTAARDPYGEDWPETAREIVGILYLYASHHPQDPSWCSWLASCPWATRTSGAGGPTKTCFKPRYGSKNYVVGPVASEHVTRRRGDHVGRQQATGQDMGRVGDITGHHFDPLAVVQATWSPKLWAPACPAGRTNGSDPSQCLPLGSVGTITEIGHDYKWEQIT